MGSVYLRGRKWWIKYYKNGEPKREPTGFLENQKKKAENLLKRKEGDVASGRPVSPMASRLLMSKLLDNVVVDFEANGRRTVDHEKRIVKRLKEALGFRRAQELTASHVRDYIAKRQREGAKNATINRELSALKRAFNLGLKDEAIFRKPYIPKLAEHNVRKGFFGDVEYLALHEALPVPLNHMVQFGYTYGWRKGEIMGLQWPQVDLQAGTVRIEGDVTKNGEARTVVLTDALRATLRKLWEETRALSERKDHPIPWVFHRRGLPVRDFRGAWASACKRAGLPGRLFHDLRRSAIRNMVRKNISDLVAMKFSGHKTRSVFDRYNIISEGDLREAANKLSGGTTEEFTGTIPDTMGKSDEVSVGRYPL